MPRLAFTDLAYAGAFRVPAGSINGETLGGGSAALAFNPHGPSLFITSLGSQVAELSIPTPAVTNNLDEMPFAQFLQGFGDPVEGHLGQVGHVGAFINSLVVHNNRLYGTASIYYDALNEQRISHFYRGLNLKSSNFQGFSQVWEPAKTGFVAGNLALVPEEWRQALGGAMVSGQCCVPIVTRTSWGPAAFAFDPNAIGQGAVPASPLLYYTQDHPTLGQWGSSNEYYGESTEMGGLVIVAGTRTALYFGRNGIGPACYGHGTADASLAGKTASDGALWCYDPTSPYKGTHAYPYRYQIWAYDLNDFAAVKAGTKSPWEVRPYDVWPFDLPTPEARVSIGGVAYDAEHQAIYLVQNYADPNESRPIIHVLNVGGTGQALNSSHPTPNQVGKVTISANAAAPQPLGRTITFAAAAQGGTAPYQYKWMTTSDGLNWSSGSWSANSQFAWTPPIESAQHRVRVWVRGGNNNSDQPEAIATVSFPIVRSLIRVTVAGTSSPQVLGTPLNFTATASNGTAPYQFRWRVFDAGSWSVRANWGPSNTFTWTPASARSDYQIEVSVRSAGQSSDDGEGSVTVPFVINAPAAAKVGGVNLTSDVASPQAVGTSVRFTANAAGGAAPLQYKWSTFDGSSWMAVTGWSGAATFNWKPGAPGSYQIAVAVRSSGSSADQGEASTQVTYVMTAAPSGGGGSAPAAGPFTSVSINANRESPQAAGTSITWSATPSGSSGPALYKWLVNDGTKWVASSWSASPSFAWTPEKPGTHLIGVWVKRADNYNDMAEASYTTAYIIK